MTDKKRFILSGTGCALVDYLYQPIRFSDPDFARYLSNNPGDGGLSPGKLVFTEEFGKFIRKPYSETRNLITNGMQPVAVNIGGPSIVPLIHAAQLLNGRNAEVRFLGVRGADAGGEFIVGMLQKTPLKSAHFKIGTRFTPFTDVLSDPGYDQGHGERMFINNIGAARELLPDDLPDSFFESDLVVFGGTALVPNIHSALGGLVKKTREHRAITVVNTVYDFLSEKKDPARPWPLGDTDDTYRYIDLLVMDREEALRLSGAVTVEDALDHFRSAGTGAAVITHGSHPVHFYADNILFGQVPRSSLPVSERVRTELGRGAGRTGDTTGCGDNFVGGMIASMAGQLCDNPGKPVDLRHAIALGVTSGGYTCFYHGGTYYEKHPGEKKQVINEYYLEYLKQINLEK